MGLLSSSILMDTKIFFSNSHISKTLIDSEKKFENLKNKVLILAEKAPKRGDLIMPFIAIAFKKNRLDVINDICNRRNVKGEEGYCNLVKGYQILNKEYINKNLDNLVKDTDLSKFIL